MNELFFNMVVSVIKLLEMNKELFAIRLVRQELGMRFLPFDRTLRALQGSLALQESPVGHKASV